MRKITKVTCMPKSSNDKNKLSAPNLRTYTGGGGGLTFLEVPTKLRLIYVVEFSDFI